MLYRSSGELKASVGAFSLGVIAHLFPQKLLTAREIHSFFQH